MIIFIVDLYLTNYTIVLGLLLSFKDFKASGFWFLILWSWNNLAKVTKIEKRAAIQEFGPFTTADGPNYLNISLYHHNQQFRSHVFL
jgi:hypothetical protein